MISSDITFVNRKGYVPLHLKVNFLNIKYFFVKLSSFGNR